MSLQNASLFSLSLRACAFYFAPKLSKGCSLGKYSSIRPLSLLHHLTKLRSETASPLTVCSITTAYGSNLSSFIDTVRAPSSIGCIIKITSNHFGLKPWHDSTHDRSSYLPTRRPTTFVSVTRLHIMPEKWPVRIGGNYFRSVLFYHESRERTL